MDDARKKFTKHMNWLRKNRIGLSQRPEEFYPVWKRVYELQPKKFIEIGSHTGGSLKMYAAACKFPAKIVCIDKPFAPSPRTKQLKFVISKLIEEGHTVTHFSGSSTTPEFIKGAKKLIPKADFVHIDGNHDYEYALADWENYGILVKEGGLVALHDLEMERRPDEEPPGVGRLYDELEAQGYGCERFVQLKNLGKLHKCGIGLITIPKTLESNIDNPHTGEQWVDGDATPEAQ